MTTAPQPEGPSAEPLKGWKLNHIQFVRGSGKAEIGYLGPEDDGFYPVVTVDTGLYYQPEHALPLARAILAALAAPEVPAPVAEPVAWRDLYRRAFNEAYGLTNYVEDRPELRSAERRLAKIEEEARALYASPSVPQAVPQWRPIETAPLDGTLVRLLVRFDHNAIEDTTDPTVTIGSHNDGEWNFVGWCWHTDEWARGSGDLLGWLPLLAAAPSAKEDPLVSGGS